MCVWNPGARIAPQKQLLRESSYLPPCSEEVPILRRGRRVGQCDSAQTRQSIIARGLVFLGDQYYWAKWVPCMPFQPSSAGKVIGRRRHQSCFLFRKNFFVRIELIVVDRGVARYLRTLSESAIVGAVRDGPDGRSVFGPRIQNWPSIRHLPGSFGPDAGGVDSSKTDQRSIPQP